MRTFADVAEVRAHLAAEGFTLPAAGSAFEPWRADGLTLRRAHVRRQGSRLAVDVSAVAYTAGSVGGLALAAHARNPRREG